MKPRRLKDPFTFRDFLAFLEDGGNGDLTYEAAQILFDHIARQWYIPVAISEEGEWIYEHKTDQHTWMLDMRSPLTPPRN